jgi:hypothetical protein
MRRLISRSSSRTSGRTLDGLAISLTVAVLAACSTPSSSTDLNPEGPPMVLQVLVSEKVVGEDDTVRIKTGLAFGDHPDKIFEGDDRMVSAAVARGNQRVRVILDELVNGRSLEELACADGSFSPVSLTASGREPNPDDVAACSGNAGELEGCEVVCVGHDGILDVDNDGAADDTRMIDFGRTADNPAGTGELAVNIVCGDQPMALDPQASFFNPSGNQQIPAGDIGLNGLGPSILLVPTQGIKTGAGCTIKFREDVTDRDGNRVCAPSDGKITGACPADGDTGSISFSVEALALASSDPEEGAVVQAGVDPTSMLLQFNAALDATTLTAITLTEAGGGAVAGAVVSLSADDPSIVNITVTGGLAVNTSYVITATTALQDIYGGVLPAALTISFTTNAGQPAPDAAPADAAIDATI